MSDPDDKGLAPQLEALHATAVVIGEAGVLIRGPSGAGKSSLALLLLAEAGRFGRFARLIGDDRVIVARVGGRLVARTHPAIAGLIERRTQTMARLAFENACIVKLVVDLHTGAERLPRLPVDTAGGTIRIHDVELARLRIEAPSGSLGCLFVFHRLGVD